MKIAFIGGFAFFPKGTIRARAHPLAAELVKRGHDVTIFLAPYDNPADFGREWEQDGVCIRNASAGSSSRSDPLSPKRLALLAYPRLLKNLISAVQHFQPDLLHIFKPKGFAGAAGTYFLSKGARVILDCDDWEGWGGWNEVKDYPWLVKEYIDRQECWMMRRVPVITAASKTLERRANEIRKHRRGVYYLPNCAASGANRQAQRSARAITPAATRTRLGLPDRPTVLFSGHIDEIKGASSFIRAVCKAAQNSPLSVIFAGDDAMSEKLCHELNAQTPISAFFFPRLPYEEFIRVVWASDIAVFPYSDDAIHHAKCSARIVDYMAMGKPVVTSAIGQNLEYIVNGDSGILVPPDDDKSLTRELALLLHDPELRACLGRNAERRIKNKFQWDSEPLQNCLAAYELALN